MSSKKKTTKTSKSKKSSTKTKKSKDNDIPGIFRMEQDYKQLCVEKKHDTSSKLEAKRKKLADRYKAFNACTSDSCPAVSKKLHLLKGCAYITQLLRENPSLAKLIHTRFQPKMWAKFVKTSTKRDWVHVVRQLDELDEDELQAVMSMAIDRFATRLERENKLVIAAPVAEPKEDRDRDAKVTPPKTFGKSLGRIWMALAVLLVAAQQGVSHLGHSHGSSSALTTTEESHKSTSLVTPDDKSSKKYNEASVLYSTMWLQPGRGTIISGGRVYNPVDFLLQGENAPSRDAWFFDYMATLMDVMSDFGDLLNPDQENDDDE